MLLMTILQQAQRDHLSVIIIINLLNAEFCDFKKKIWNAFSEAKELYGFVLIKTKQNKQLIKQ